MAPPPRRKRYRYRLRKLIPVFVVALVAGGAGAWAGSRQHAAPVATLAAPPTPRAVVVAPVVTKTIHREQLLHAAPVAHTFRPALLAEAAILVDGSSGRVLWQLHAHQHRHVASTTKIMTALLALRKLGPSDIVTVDKSVPRVPLVREGLRAGERV